MTFKHLLASLVATTLCGALSHAAASPPAGASGAADTATKNYGYEAKVEPIDGHQLPPQPTADEVRFLTKANGAEYRSLCKITIADAWVDDKPESYRRQIVEQAQRCGAPAVFVGNVKEYKNRAVVFAEGLELLTADAHFLEPARVQPLLEAVKAQKTKAARRLLSPLPKTAKERTKVDNMVLQTLLNATARRGKACSATMVKLFMDDYGVVLDTLKTDISMPYPTWQMILCKDVVKRSFEAAADKSAFMQEIIATYGARRYVMDVDFVRAFHDTLEPVVATTREACAENRESELCQIGATLKKIGSAMRDSLPTAKLKPASKRVMRKLATRLMTAAPE